MPILWFLRNHVFLNSLVPLCNPICKLPLFYSLAVADILLIIEMVVERSLVYHFNEPLWYVRTYPYFWHPIKGIFLSATMFTIVAVSAERYRAVCHPLSQRHVSKNM